VIADAARLLYKEFKPKKMIVLMIVGSALAVVATLVGAAWKLSGQLSQTATKTDLLILAAKADLK
jgi:hypothetical protein